MNIYVTTFEQFDSKDCLFGVAFRHSYDDIEDPDILWWNNTNLNGEYYFPDGYKMKKGSVVCIDLFSMHNGSPVKNRVYMIFTTDFTIHRDSEDDSIVAETFYLAVPGRVEDEDEDNGLFIPDVNGDRIFYIDDGHFVNRLSETVIASVTPNNTSLLEKPWRFVTQGVVNDYLSFQWYDKYNVTGEFTLNVIMSTEMLDLLRPGRYLMIGKSPKVMIIEKTTTNANLRSDGYLMKVTGRSLESILDRRVAFPGKGLNTNIYKSSDGLRKAINDLVVGYFIDPTQVVSRDTADASNLYYYPKRAISFLTTDQSEEMSERYSMKRTFRASVNKNVSKDDLLSVISELAQNNNLGFALIPTHRYGGPCIQWEFTTYVGADKSYTRQNKEDPLLVFSPSLGNVLALSTVKDSTNKKNFIFCAKEKDAEQYINLATFEDNSAMDAGISDQSFLGNAANWLISKIKNVLVGDETNFSNTAILFLACAAMDNTQSYDTTVKKIDGYTIGDYPTKIDNERRLIKYKIPYAVASTNETRDRVYKKEGQFYSDDFDAFVQSTAYGWLTPVMLRRATTMLNNMPAGGTGQFTIIQKTNVQRILAGFDGYTSNYTLTKWLCETYTNDDRAEGIERKEAFVDEENTNDDEWTNSKMIAFMNSTELVTEEDDGEESDEDIKKRLKETARKKISEYGDQHYVDATCDMQEKVYNEDYELGDIVQVNDEYGETEQYIIDQVTISDDTSSGELEIPSFTRYSEIPKAYTRLEYLAVANMKTTILFDHAQNDYANQFIMNAGDKGIVDEGPETTHENGTYIRSIFMSRPYTWTQIDMDVSYNPNRKEAKNQPVALISKSGKMTEDGEGIKSQTVPFMVCDTNISPIHFGIPYHIDNNGEIDRRLMGGSDGERRVSMLMHDIKVDDPDEGPWYHNFGIPLIAYAKWGGSDYIHPLVPDPTALEPNRCAPSSNNEILLDAPHSTNFRHYVVNEPKYYEVNDVDTGRIRKRLFSESHVDDLLIGQYPKSDYWFGIFSTKRAADSYSSLRRVFAFVPAYHDIVFNAIHATMSHMLYSNTIVTDGYSVSGYGMDERLFEYDNSQFNEDEDYLYIGGCSMKTGDNTYVNKYDDPANGVAVKELISYEYEATARAYGYDNTDGGEENAFGDAEANSGPRDPLVPDSRRIYNPHSILVDIDSKRISHRYIPVRYNDVRTGDEEIDDEEKYGFYDTVNEEFISIKAGGGTFIEAGGDVNFE